MCSLPPCILLLIMRNLEMLPLLRCRLVNRRFKQLADSEIHGDMRRIVGYYLREPDGFLAALVRYGAVVSSEAALALFLHDPSVLDHDLEVSVKHGTEKEFNEYIRTSLPVVRVWENKRPESPYRRAGVYDVTGEGRPQRDTTTYKITGVARLYIRVVGCSYPTPLGAISSLRNTALLCFFSPILMGCAYPYLTLRRLGLHRETNMAVRGVIQGTPSEFIKNIRLVTQAGFRFSWDPRDFILPIPTAHSWRELLVAPDPQGQIFTPWDWNWIHKCGPAVGPFKRDAIEEELSDWNCYQGMKRIAKLWLHLEPSFVGEEIL
ncbi:hypothetical protein C8T65DRAFT_700302 [Cerioporus squamosus]|nr:hypothetical protein C8T65DRAFT_700302 [Cerioporus squamosus]